MRVNYIKKDVNIRIDLIAVLQETKYQVIIEEIRKIIKNISLIAILCVCRGEGTSGSHHSEETAAYRLPGSLHQHVYHQWSGCDMGAPPPHLHLRSQTQEVK